MYFDALTAVMSYVATEFPYPLTFFCKHFIIGDFWILQ